MNPLVINVIGLNVDEAIFVIDKFLDDSYLAKLQTIRIVHGKGTGKLREGIHKFLKTNSHVRAFRIGTFGEGEMGVTVVELKWEKGKEGRSLKSPQNGNKGHS